MRFGGIVAPNSGCLSLTLGLCSSFSFGMVSVLLSSFDAPLKCTVNTIEFPFSSMERKRNRNFILVSTVRVRLVLCLTVY